MGVCLKDVEVLIKLREEGYLPDQAAVIEIGAQQVSNSVLRAITKVEHLGRLFGAHSAPPLPQPLASDVNPEGYERQSPAAPAARELWKWLGCSYSAIDIDGSPGAIPLDLNDA